MREQDAAYTQGFCPSSEIATDRHLGEPKIDGVVAVRSGSEWKFPLTLVRVSLPLFQREPTTSNSMPPITLVKLDDYWRILLKTPSR